MSILEELADYDGKRGRIVSFTLVDNDRFVEIEECCDNYFSTRLNRQEFSQMIAELQAIYSQMVDSPPGDGEQVK